MVPTTVNRIEIAMSHLALMGKQVEKAVARAVASLAGVDFDGARQVVEEDKVINSFEIDIDNITYNLLALSTNGMPQDLLRKILTVQKINPMLERIGDHAVNIAESVIVLASERYKQDVFLVGEMAGKCIRILHDALAGLFSGNVELAEEVLQCDEEVDTKQDIIVRAIKSELLSAVPLITFEAGFALFGIVKDLERIADLSMNIAEETLFTVEGIIVKHRVCVKR